MTAADTEELEARLRAYEKSLRAKNEELKTHWAAWRLLAKDDSVRPEWRRIARRRAGMPGA